MSLSPDNLELVREQCVPGAEIATAEALAFFPQTLNRMLDEARRQGAVTDPRLIRLRELRDAARPLPEQDSRVGEAMAGRFDSERRRTFEHAAIAFVNQLLDA